MGARDSIQSSEPRLVRSAAGEGDLLDRLLPAYFLDLQGEPRERARAVAVAARARDNAQLLAAYGQLTETCVTCHAAYRQDAASGDEAGD
jgi:mono/diheme cytochrome c family protein